MLNIRHTTVESPDSWPFALEVLAPWVNSLDIKDFTWQYVSSYPEEIQAKFEEP